MAQIIEFPADKTTQILQLRAKLINEQNKRRQDELAEEARMAYHQHLIKQYLEATSHGK